MNVQFPLFQSHAFVVCMNCGSDLTATAPKDDGYPTGRGKYRKTCAICAMSTWYDVKQEAQAT